MQYRVNSLNIKLMYKGNVWDWVGLYRKFGCVNYLLKRKKCLRFVSSVSEVSPENALSSYSAMASSSLDFIKQGTHKTANVIHRAS